jgi:hypothetical protein
LAFYLMVDRTEAIKITGLPATYTSRDSCPKRCPRRGTSCYADNGPVAWAWRRCHSTLDELLDWVGHLPHGQMWRHNVAGDLPGDGVTLNHEQCIDLAAYATRTMGWTYTHYDAHRTSNYRTLLDMRELGFNVLLSADTATEADMLAGLGIAPVAVVLPLEPHMLNEWRIATPMGRGISICKHYLRGTNCTECRLCQQAMPGQIIGLPYH